MENKIAQVVLVRDINPGISDYGYVNGSNAYGFTEFNEQLFFTANDGENGNELWVSDGTTEGTQLLLDINPGIGNYGYANGSYVSGFTEFDGKLYFTANDGENGNELWVSDGTTEGTQLLQDINPGVGNNGYTNGSYASNFIVFEDELIFTANNGQTGGELFKLTFDDFGANIIGTDSADNLTGSDAAEEINGLKGNDTLNGKGGNDVLKGGKGNDSLSGGNGNDVLKGGKGSDSLSGGNGHDVLTGGKGNDIFEIASGSGEDTITDFSLGHDHIGLSAHLSYSDLSFSGSTISVGEELLATLPRVNTEHLTSHDFV